MSQISYNYVKEEKDKMNPKILEPGMRARYLIYFFND